MSERRKWCIWTEAPLPQKYQNASITTRVVLGTELQLIKNGVQHLSQIGICFTLEVEMV